MAGDWIMFEHATLDKPEVFAIADKLGISEGDALIGLLRVWVWADQQTTDGNADHVTTMRIDAIARFDGFATTMEMVGWLRLENGGIALPHFRRLNTQTAKTRGLTRIRVAAHRADGSTHGSVTYRREENRREEKNKEKKETLPEVIALVKLYGEIVKPASLDGSRHQAKINVTKMLAQHSVEKLEQAVNNYADAMTILKTEHRYRKNSGNFFGRDAVFMSYLPGEYEKPESPNAPESPEAYEKRRAERSAKTMAELKAMAEERAAEAAR